MRSKFNSASIIATAEPTINKQTKTYTKEHLLASRRFVRYRNRTDGLLNQLRTATFISQLDIRIISNLISYSDVSKLSSDTHGSETRGDQTIKRPAMTTVSESILLRITLRQDTGEIVDDQNNVKYNYLLGT